jgi:hypothetical protein
VITGFNTDIEFQGVTYHVQTEDKGVKTPLILSLVYDRGTILASKRSPYDDLLVNEFNEKELEERLQRQHKLICAAVRAGRIDDLRQMTLKESAAKQKAKGALMEVKPLAEVKRAEAVGPAEETAGPEKKSIEAAPEKKAAPAPAAERKPDEIPIPQLLKSISAPSAGGGTAPQLNDFSISAEEPLKTRAAETEILEIPISVLEDLIIEDVEIVEEEMILPAEVVEEVQEAAVADSAKNAPVDESLRIELLNEVKFKSGERKTLSVVVKRGDSESGLSGAHVMVKILGSSFRPVVFHAKTDSNGVAVVQLHLPQFSRGRAAVLIRAMSGGEETELRRIISQD